MKVTFICGCQTNEILNRDNVKTMDTVAYDAEGFLVCAIHNERRYGWRSIPRGFSRSMPALQREAYIVFGEPVAA